MAGWVTWFEYKFYLPLLSAEHQRQLQLNLKYLFLEVVPKFLWLLLLVAFHFTFSTKLYIL